MALNQEDTDEPQPSEGPLQPGDRVREEERKELASLDKAAAPDMEMDEKRQAALMTSLEQGETKATTASRNCTVSGQTVKQLADLLLLPAAEVEAALQQSEGDYLKATRLLLEQ